MQSKLQELTEKIFREGVQQGEVAAQRIREEAEANARTIIEEAEQEAAEIRRQARVDAERQQEAVQTELRLAAGRAQNQCRRQITELLLNEVLGPSLEEAFEDPKFLKQLITALVKSWAGAGGVELVFSEDEKDSLMAWAAREYRIKLGKGIEVTADEQLKATFAVRPQGEGYMVQFDADSFQQFFAALLRPATQDLLFGTPSSS